MAESRAVASFVSVMESSAWVRMPLVRGTVRTLCEDGIVLRRHSEGIRDSLSACLREAMDCHVGC